MSTLETTMPEEKNIAIIIPAYNEAVRIASTLQSLSALSADALIVVDDGSTDETAIIAESAAIVLKHHVNRGMGAALRTGTRYALELGADIIVHFDADGQHRADEVEKMIAPLTRDEADIVIGSRYLKRNRLPWTKRYLLHMPALVFQNLFSGIRLSDVHNGFRAMNRKAAECIVISQDRMAHASEIISEIRRHQLRYTEVPVTISYREYGQGFVAGLRILKELLIGKLTK